MTLFKKEQNPSPKSGTAPPKAGTAPPKKVLPTGLQPTLINGVSNHNHNHAKDNHKIKPTKKVSNGSIKATNHEAKEAVLQIKQYHWQSDGVKRTSVDDMVLLSKISEAAITENLRKRLMEDKIYTYIGPVLVAVNPFKQLPYFGDKEVNLYQGAAHYEVPPHIYAVADSMYRNMLIDSDSQCVIISGESGAGKTVSAKFIMNYLTRVSGGGARVQKVKDVILGSNPLLEAFGNAKTIRNNNSSRFGKYIEIEFSRGGEPQGGRISNFLLEKSRVHFLNENERNFHIFYQFCTITDENLRSALGVAQHPSYYNYLSQSGVYSVDGTDDAQDFQETINAMGIMGIDTDTQMEILKVVAAILHMGNITFVENGNKGQIQDPDYLEYPAQLLGIDSQSLNEKLTSRIFDSKWGSVFERVNVHLNVEQAQFARDAWSKGLYLRLFDYIVQTVNSAMETTSNELNLGILDIYGFEIFGRNGFEQFCINYVNEKLQQIFIELTLKNEQEEYVQEGIEWRPINFFNNKIVCDLIESRRPPGIFSVLDDTVATMNAVSEGADDDFRNKMSVQVGSNAHYQPFKDGFTIKHYAGKVDYHIDGFCEKNRDVLFVDIIELMQQSSSPFIRYLFPDNISNTVKGRPTTAAMKIRTHTNTLMTKLTACVPSYIRCIKPNETKKPKDWDEPMVKTQVEYLGLKENIKVKRAGFAYRRPFEKFIRRYSILATGDARRLMGNPKQEIERIMDSVNLSPPEYQLGLTKCFIKDPESLYMLEEYRERKFDYYARVIQKAFRKYFSKQSQSREKTEASNVLLYKKRRRTNSVNRNFYGDYIGVQYKPSILGLIPRREKIVFSETVKKYDRQFKTCLRDLVLTKNNLYLLGLEKVQKGPKKGQFMEVIKRKIELQNIAQVTMSTYADNFVLIRVKNDVESLLEITFKTEFLMLLNRTMMEVFNYGVQREFTDRFQYKVKKTRFSRGGTRSVNVSEGSSPEAEKSVSGTTLSVRIMPHLPPGTHSSIRVITPEVRIMKAQLGSKPQDKNYSPLKKHSRNNPRGVPNSYTVRPAPRPPVNQVSPGGRSSPIIPHGQPIRLPSANQKWPSTGTNEAHIVPPPPTDPAPLGQPVVSRVPPVIKPKPKIKQVKALYSFNARDTEELTFSEGDVMELIDEDDSGWWTCRYRSKTGFCPGNYLEKI